MIPKTFHFVGSSEFSFTAYIAVKSVRASHPAARILFHTDREPGGLYWEVARRHVEVVRLAEVDQHTRLRLLLAHGGISLGLDTITAKPFDDLLAHQAVMGLCGNQDQTPSLGTAVVLAQAGSGFIQRWLAAEQSAPLRESLSGSLAYRAALAAPGEVVVLGSGAFDYPTGASGAMSMLLEDRTFPNAFAHHLDVKRHRRLLATLDERNVHLVDSSYNRLARQVIAEDGEVFARLRQLELESLIRPPIRVNLGSGANKRPGWLNVDSQPAASPDLAFDLTVAPWPLADNSVHEAELSHVLEHTGDRFETVIKELYRVCMDGAIAHVRVPHPRHDWFLADPTHSRPLLPLTFHLLDASACKQGLLTGQTATPLAVYWRVDFETLSVRSVASADGQRLQRHRLLAMLHYPYWRQWRERAIVQLKRWLGRPVTALKTAQEMQLDFLSRFVGNMVGELQIELRIRKQDPSNSDPGPDAGPIQLTRPTQPDGTPSGRHTT